ncbi:MAG TPA: hypothetical protein VNG51_20210 [Ktedonobacteraceae bacterium]|nr:hypothetical protein [Ktedonobacteraceae bacterium]
MGARRGRGLLRRWTLRVTSVGATHKEEQGEGQKRPFCDNTPCACQPCACVSVSNGEMIAFHSVKNPFQRDYLIDE